MHLHDPVLDEEGAREQEQVLSSEKVEAVEVAYYAIPLDEPLWDATHGEMRDFALIVVRLTFGEGIEGIGYTYTVGRFGASAIFRMLVDDLGPYLLKTWTGQIEHVWRRLWWLVHYAGRGGASSFGLSAIDIALWDARAKRAGLPLWKLLGGHEPRVRVYAGGIDLHLEEAELLKRIERQLEAGYRAIKIKVGSLSLQRDVTRIKAVRRLIGNKMPLMVDANMCWTPDQAIRAAHAFAEYEIYWLEEPTVPDDFEAHRRILQEGGVPIAAGENLRTLHEFKHLIAAGGVSFPGPDVSNVGGVTVWMKVAHLAEAYNLPVTCHGVQDLHVHLMAAVPNASYMEIHGFSLDKFLVRPMQIQDGYVTAPDGPGHGVEFLWEKMQPYLVMKEQLNGCES